MDQLVTGFEGANKIQVVPMTGIWKIPFDGIKELVKTAPVHSYQQRILDTGGNAKGSFVFNLNNEHFQKIL